MTTTHPPDAERLPKEKLKPIKDPQDLKAPGNAPYKLVHYGDRLKGNKALLWRVLNHLSATAEEKRMVMAIAMQETTHMASDQRDTSKDDAGGARNVSILNVNIDMLGQAGYRADGDAWGPLNETRNLPVVCDWTIQAMRKWGCRCLLDFHRGGRTAFKDGKSYGADGYRNAIATMMPLLRADIDLAARNDLRIEIDVRHV